EGMIPPVIVVPPSTGATSSGTSVVILGSQGSSGHTSTSTSPLGPTSTSAHGAGVSTIAGSTHPLAVSPNTALAGVPPYRHGAGAGKLDTGHTSILLVIPVGPNTQAVGVSVRAAKTSETASAPVVEQMLLVDQNGFTIAQVGPLWNRPANEPPDAVT